MNKYECDSCGQEGFLPDNAKENSPEVKGFCGCYDSILSLSEEE